MGNHRFFPKGQDFRQIRTQSQHGGAPFSVGKYSQMVVVPSRKPEKSGIAGCLFFGSMKPEPVPQSLPTQALPLVVCPTTPVVRAVWTDGATVAGAVVQIPLHHRRGGVLPYILPPGLGHFSVLPVAVAIPTAVQPQPVIPTLNIVAGPFATLARGDVGLLGVGSFVRHHRRFLSFHPRLPGAQVSSKMPYSGENTRNTRGLPVWFSLVLWAESNLPALDRTSSGNHCTRILPS